MDFIKKNSKSLLCILVGILNFILFAFTYLSITFLSWISWTGTQTAKLSGYDYLDLWGDGFLGVLLSLFQLFVLIGAIALIVVGVIMLVRNAFGANIPEIPGLKYETLAKFILWGYCGLNAVIFVLGIIFAIANDGDPGFGLFLMLAFNVAYFLCDYIFIPKYLGSAGRTQAS